MIYLVISVLLNVWIFVVFKYFSIYRVNRLQAIVVNYWACVITGVLFLSDIKSILDVGYKTPWIPLAFSTGILFIITFNLMAYCTQVFSVTVSSVSSKIALVIPVLFSLFVLKIGKEQFHLLNYLGIILAIASVFFTSIRNEKQHTHISGIAILLIPLGVFFFSGAIDVILNYANFHVIPDKDEKVYPIFAFLTAASIGTAILLLKRSNFQRKSFFAGVVLGVPNYFSIYFLLKALSVFNNNGAVLYPIFNIGIILVSTFFSIVLFKEKLSTLNKLGLFFAVIAILLISFGEFL